ncbi:MAG: FUSC family protein [Actinomycetes bacterium]
MTRYATRIARASVKVDLSTVRWTSAIRRGLVVMAVLVIGYYCFEAQVGVQGATAALLVGLLDKGRSPRETWRVMATGTGLLCVVSAVAGLLHGDTVGSLLLMASLAFASGISFGIDARAPQVLLFGALMAVTHVGAPTNATQTVAGIVIVALAGGLQTMVSWLASPVVRDLPERRKIISALLSTAKLSEQISADTPPFSSAEMAASAALAAAEDFVSRSDLSAQNRRNCALLLGDADLIRLEARAYAAREQMGFFVPTDTGTREAFSTAAHVLRASAQSIARFGPATARQDLRGMRADLEHEDRRTGLSRVGTSILDASTSACDHTETLLEYRDVHRAARRDPVPLATRIAESLNWRSLPFKHGVRMAAAATTGEVLSLLVGLPHGSWVAVTAMMLLRPDVGPTAPRIWMRAGGTTIGTSIVLLIAWLCGGSPAALMAIIAVVAVLTYAMISVNYGFLVALITATVLLIMSLVEPDTFFLAWTRWTDVLVGCLVGTVFAVLFPLWQRTSLAQDTGDYITAVADWFTNIATACRTAPNLRAELLETLREGSRHARQCRLRADSTLSVSMLEPAERKGISPGVIGNLIASVRRCSDGGIAAETLLIHGAPSSANAEREARATAQALTEVALLILQPSAPGGSWPEPTPGVQPPPPAKPDHSDRLGEVLAVAAATADRALFDALQLRAPHP